MHKDFAEWYRTAKIVPNGEWLSKRWEAIENLFPKSINNESLLELVRLFRLKPVKDNKFLEKYLGAFQASDPAFPMRNNKVELGVLAGASIIYLLANSSPDVVDSLALATICSGCQGIGPPVPVQEIEVLVGKALLERSASLHLGGHVPEIKAPQNIKKMSKLLENFQSVCTGNNLQTIAQPIKDQTELLVQGINALASSTIEAIDGLGKLLQFQQEETNVLWWLFGGNSRDLKRPISNLGLPAASIITGKELSDLTEVLPGPISAEAFLDKMLSASRPKRHKSTTIQEAVNMSPRDWRIQIASKTDITIVEDFCPILFAVKKSIETIGDEDWLPAFKTATSIDLKAEIDPLRLSMQMYQENLLIKSIKHWS